MGSIPNDVRRLLDDCEMFVSEILQDEKLSEEVEETRQVLLNNFRVVFSRNPQEFPSRLDEDGSDDNRSSSLGRSAPSDDASVASDNQEDGGAEFFDDIPPVAAYELTNILKQGYLEKRRRDHSFFGSEWQKRWCVLNNSIFYYYGTEKDKQQKGSFHISEFGVQLVPNLRKDSKKSYCFELYASGRKPFQFTASSSQEAREWVDQIQFLLRDLSSSFIPYDDEEEDKEEEYDDIDPQLPAAPHRGPGEDGEDEDIYEELPDEGLEEPWAEPGQRSSRSADYANFYQGLWDCRADEPDELDFHRGDLIYIISKEYNIHGWWVGELNGSVGIVPKDYLHPAYVL